jgi:Spermine/spermidine synthase domain
MAIPITHSALLKISAIVAFLDDFVVWNRAALESPVEPLLLVIVALLLIQLIWWLILQIFIPFGQIIGQSFADTNQPVRSYSINIIASLLGSWLFLMFSYFNLQPYIWFLTFLFILFFAIPEARKINLVFISIVIGISAWIFSGDKVAEQTTEDEQITWSHYQKLTIKQNLENNRPEEKIINVNNCPYQAMLNLNKEHALSNPGLYEPEQVGLSQYDLPYLLHKNPISTLILGAGSGNDAAGAIRNGVQLITAVEIDSAIIEMGKRHHPENPYSSLNVEILNDDARSVISSTQKKFDVISFGLLDSHTTTSVTNTRLDHNVYTKETIQRTKELLKEGGIIALTFEAQKYYIADRMARLLRDEFKQNPIAIRIPYNSYGWGGIMFIAGDIEQAKEQIASNPRLNKLITKWNEAYPLSFSFTTKLTTDDWPYIYLDSPRIPIIFILVGIMTVLLFLYAQRRLLIPVRLRNWAKKEYHFFFLGAAFLLLELQGINMSAIALGSTWWVSAVVISGILVVVLLANISYYYFLRKPGNWTYIMLLLSLIILYSFNFSSLCGLPFIQKSAIVSLLVAMPIYFAGLIFIKSFESTSQRQFALAINILGSVFGSILQAISFLTGIKALLILIGMFYMIAMFCDDQR